MTSLSLSGAECSQVNGYANSNCHVVLRTCETPDDPSCTAWSSTSVSSGAKFGCRFIKSAEWKEWGYGSRYPSTCTDSIHTTHSMPSDSCRMGYD